jgi:hypothetical protein
MIGKGSAATSLAAAKLFDSSTVIALQPDFLPVISNDFYDLPGKSRDFIDGAFFSGGAIFLQYRR